MRRFATVAVALFIENEGLVPILADTVDHDAFFKAGFRAVIEWDVGELHDEIGV